MQTHCAVASLIGFFVSWLGVHTHADIRELMTDNVLRQIAAETSGEAAKRNLDSLTLQHRMRSGPQFDAATQHILDRLRNYGLDDVALLEYPADGKTMFGTQKSRPLWEVRFAELWELAIVDGKEVRRRRMGDWNAVPLTLAQDSLAGEVRTTLVDIGAGISAADYRGKRIKGKLVLTSSQPGAVVEEAVGKRGAAGIISYAPNQTSAWWKQDDRLVRWGHLGSFPKTESFGFMISLREARNLQQRLAKGEEILWHAKVDASHTIGTYGFATAVIRGTSLAAEDVHLTCHLDHPRPGANDNASGCVAILETARTLSTLIEQGILPEPARSIRFLWPAEIEGSIMYLAEHAEPSRIKANIHMDMVGGGPITKSIFRISGGPMSVPSFVSDLGHEIGRFVNEHTLGFASSYSLEYPLNAPEGGKEPLMALFEGLSMGSDHDVFFEGTWQIPGLYLHDWPDRYIHTNYDLAANIDPTKLKRAAFIGAVSAWYLANLSAEDVPAVLQMLRRNAMARSARLLERRNLLSAEDAVAATAVHFEVERRKVVSIERFAPVEERDRNAAMRFLGDLQALAAAPEAGVEAGVDGDRNATIYIRNAEIKGPMTAFGYSYLSDKYGQTKRAELRLLLYQGTHGSGGAYAYEALNLVDGQRSVSEIRDWLMTELGPVPLVYVEEYLEALASIDVIRRQRLE